MEKSNTSERLKYLLNLYNIKPIDIVNRCQPFCKKYNEKIGRNHISQYLNGINEPGQRKLTILSEALNVSPVWLMGYDVPMQDSNYPTISSIKNQINNLSEHDMNKKNKESLIDMVNFYHEKTIKEEKELNNN